MLRMITQRWPRLHAATASLSWRTRWRPDGSDKAAQCPGRGAARSAAPVSRDPKLRLLDPGSATLRAASGHDKRRSLQQLHRIGRLLLQLLERALPRCLVWA